jgi:hypothetical protein
MLLGVQLGLEQHRNMSSFPSTTRIPSSSTANSTITRSTDEGGNINILLFMTTVFSQRHIDYFHCCWPKLVEESQLLKRAHIMIFSNNETDIDETTLQYTENLFQNSPSFEFKFAPDHEIKQIQKLHLQINRFQVGANLGMKLGVSEQWFAPYDWIIRINPDVLIRNSTWLLETMLLDPDADGVFVDCVGRTPRIHTDFFAVRPRSLSDSAFSQVEFEPNRKTIMNHEVTAHIAFTPIVQSGRARYVPNVQLSNGRCRVRGIESPIYHRHDSCRNESMICDALESWPIT